MKPQGQLAKRRPRLSYARISLRCQVFQLPKNYIHNSLATFPGFFLSGHAERMMSGAPSCNAASRVHRYICESLQLVHSYDHPEREKACAGGLSKLNCPVSWNNHRRTSTVKFQERASSKASPAAELSGRQVDHLAVLAMELPYQRSLHRKHSNPFPLPQLGRFHGSGQFSPSHALAQPVDVSNAMSLSLRMNVL